ncbi:hypothetical protein OTB23_10805 [Streptomyces sp. H34-AA3]|nr:hypothetical protein [Streptomyces sp. H34-AA3]
MREMRELDFPEDVRRMLWILIGEMPVQARENLAYESRELYLRFGKGIKDLRDEIRLSIAEASTALPQEVADRYVQGLSLLTDDGGVDHLNAMADRLDDIARSQVDHSMNIQQAKWEIIAEIVMLLLELALLAALAAITGGTSVSQMALARARSRLAVLLVVDRLLRMTHLAPSLTGAVEEALQTLAVRLAQIALNPDGRRPDGIDWRDVGKSAAFGAVVGLIGGALGGAADYFRNWFKHAFDDFDRFAKDHPRFTTLLDGVNDVAEAFVVGAVSESAGETLIQGAFEGTWDFSWSTFVGSGTSSAFETVAGGAVGGGALWLHHTYLPDPATADPFTVNRLTGRGSSRAGGGPGASGPAAPPVRVPPPLPVALPVPSVPRATAGSDPAVTGPAASPPPAWSRTPPAPVPVPIGPPARVLAASVPAVYGSSGRESAADPDADPGRGPGPGPDPYAAGNTLFGATAPAPGASVPPPVAPTAAPAGVPGQRAPGPGTYADATGDDRPDTAGEHSDSPSRTGLPDTTARRQVPAAPDSTAADDKAPHSTAPHSTADGPEAAVPTGPTASGGAPDRGHTQAGTPQAHGRGLPEHGSADAPDTEAPPEAEAVEEAEAEAADGRVGPQHTGAEPAQRSADPRTAPDPAKAGRDRVAPEPGPEDGPGRDAPGRPEAGDGAQAPGTTAEPAPATAPLTGNAAWEAARAAVAPVTRTHTWVDPVSAPADPARPGETTQYAVRSLFDVRRVAHDGDWVTDLTVRVATGPAGLPPHVWDAVRDGVEAYFNAPGHRLPDGDRLHVTVEQTPEDPHPNGLTVTLAGRDQPMTRTVWWADADPVDYAHEIAHQLGLRDEARGGDEATRRPDIPGSLLGDYTRPAPAGLPQAGLRGRHLSLLAAHVGVLTGPPPGARGPGPAAARPIRTVGGPRGAEPRAPRTTEPAQVPVPVPVPVPTVAVPVPVVPLAPPPLAPPPPVPVVTASTPTAAADGRTGTGNSLDGTRPPRLERGAAAPAARGGRRTRYADGSGIPAYVDDLASLLAEAPADLMEELLSQPAAFGQSSVVLRGSELIAAEAESLLRGIPSLRPRTPEPGSPPGTGPVADLRTALRQRPRALIGGLALPYTNTAGETRVLHVTARHYGNWERFADTYGTPTKIDTMDRATVQAGRNSSVQSATQLGLGGPFLGPSSAAAFGGFGRLALRGGFSTKAGYGQIDQATAQAETRTLDGSHVHLDDLHLTLRVTDADGRLVTEPPPAGTAGPARAAHTGFAVRDGLALRLPDSAVKPSRPGRIPRSIAMDHDTQYRLVRTEGFGPVSRIRDWAAAEIGAAPGSSAHQELDAFFSSDSFQRHARMLAAGRLATAPLFADDRRRTPLGVFVVERVVPVRATLVTETPDAELRDIATSTVRNDRSTTKAVNFGIDGVLGPAFNFLDLGGGALNLRLQFGPAFRHLFSVSRTTAFGGFGGLKTSGQVKGTPTGLYLVRKTVYVRHAGSGSPARRFPTWSLDRMTRTEARRLAGWDDGTTVPLRNGLPEPHAPAYLTPDRPPTLGMHRVEEFAHADGRRTRATDGRPSTLLDAFADTVLTALADAHPGLVAPLDRLAPPVRRGLLARARAVTRTAGPLDRARPAPHWDDADAYQTALSNTLTVLSVLSHLSLAAGLEALTTTGISIRLTDPGTFGQAHRYVRVHGELTNRRYEGRQDDLKLRHSAPGGQRTDGQESRKRATGGGADLQLAFRDPDPGAGESIGAPDNAGVLSLGWRSAVQHDSESGYGSSATNEPMSVSTKPSHLYRYDLALSASHGGYWRFRGLLRGVATLGLLGTQPFVFQSPRTLLIGTAAHGVPVRGGPVTGQVLISIPDRHAPAVDPHRPGAPNPYRTPGGPPDTTAMPLARAHALATGNLAVPAGTGDGGRAPRRGDRLFRDLQHHPFLTVAVLVPPGLTDAVTDVVRTASGGSWQFAHEGAPAREAVLRAFQPQYATANFDQSSGPLGFALAGLMGKPPYGTLWGTFRHYTAVRGVHALTGPVEMDTEMVLGSATQATGKTGRSVTHSFGSQLTYAKPHTNAGGPLGTYGFVVNPWSESAQHTLTLTRSVVADLNLKSFGHQVLVTGTVEHWAVMVSTMLGTTAARLPGVPASFAGAAGSVTSVPGGWLAHVPEKSAHLLGILDDGMGDVPRYTGTGWSPQPWTRGNTFGTYPVNTLDPTDVLSAFQTKVRALGLDEDAQEDIRRQVTSRVLRALHREATGTGTSLPSRTGGWGWGAVRIGSRRARVRVELLPGTPVLRMLDHGTEREENRRAVETRQEGAESTSGRDIGVLVGESVHTGDPTAVAAGPSYTETGTSRRAVSTARSVSTGTTYRAASTEPHAETTTPYRLRLTLEFDDTPEPAAPGADAGSAAPGTALRRFTGRQRITDTGAVGDLREHVPLSLMAPDPDPADPAPDPRLAPPDLTVATRPRSGPRPGLLGPDTLHADGTARPFTFPENGFHVRRIVGLEHVQEAGRRAIAESYGIDLTDLDAPGATPTRRTELLRRAAGTALTRPGGGAAQTLEDGTTNTALSTFYDQALVPAGYEVPGLTHRDPAGTDSARLSLHAKPDFSRAVLLTVADGKKLEVLRESAEGTGTSVSHEHTQDSAFGGGVAIRTEDTGLNQLAATATGPYAADGDGAPVGAERLSSLNVKPKTGRAFLFAVPTDWLSVAEVHRGIQDSGLGRFLAGAFGHPPRGPKAVSSQTYALAWIRDDVARELGLINDTTFPARVSAAWDAVGKAAKTWTEADRAYWKKRRASAGLREAREAARTALGPARTAVEDTTRRLAPLLDAAEAADTGLARAEADAVRDRAAASRLDAAADALDAASAAVRQARAEAARAERTARATEDAARDTVAALHGWAALPGDGPDPDAVRQAEAGLTTARRTAAALRFAAGRRIAAARDPYDAATVELAAAERDAPAAAAGDSTGWGTPATPATPAAAEPPGGSAATGTAEYVTAPSGTAEYTETSDPGGVPGPGGEFGLGGVSEPGGEFGLGGVSEPGGVFGPGGVFRPGGVPESGGASTAATPGLSVSSGPGTRSVARPGSGTERARRTAGALRTGADRRLTAAEARRSAAARRLTGPTRADAAARAALARAAARSTAADGAFDARRAELDALARAAETAAAALGRVRAATDRLTRWHQLAATAEGRRRLAGLAEPAPVTYTPPSGPPRAAEPPPAPRYTPSADGARLTSPDGAAYTVHEVPRDGDAFFHALAEGLARTAPELLARHAIDPGDPRTPRALRRLIAARLTDPADADLLAVVAPDDTDVFTAAEIDATGPAPDLAAGTPGRREFDQLGIVPHAAALDDGARAALATAQLERPGDADDEAGWDHAAADLLPLLAARTFGIDVTVVRGDGTFQTFTSQASTSPASTSQASTPPASTSQASTPPASTPAASASQALAPGRRAGSHRLRGLVDDPEAPAPHVVLFLDHRHYRLAVADPARPLPVPAPPLAPLPAAPLPAAPPTAVGPGAAPPLLPGPVDRPLSEPEATGTPPDRGEPLPVRGTGHGSFAEALLAALGDGNGVLDRRRQVPVTELAGTDVTLTAGQAAHAVLLGGSLSVEDLGLSPLQHLRWLLAGPADVAAAAEVLGIAIEVTAPGRRPHRYGSGPGEPVRLYYDGLRYSTAPQRG